MRDGMGRAKERTRSLASNRNRGQDGWLSPPYNAESAGAGNTEMHLKTHRCVCDQREWGERKGITSCRMLRMKYLLNQNKHPLQANYEIFQN